MDIQLANKIVTEVSKFSDIRCAITNDLGEVLAKTNSFDISHPLLNTRSPKASKIRFNNKNLGYLYLDETEQTLKQSAGIIKSMTELIIQQNRHAQMLTSDEKRIDQITYDFLFTDTIESRDYTKIMESFGVNIDANRTAVLLEICDPGYLMLYEREIVEGEREKVIARTKRNLETLLEVFYTQHKNNVIFYLGGKNFLILKDMGDSPADYQDEFKKTLNNLHYNIETELRTKITIGVGDFKEGLEGIKESFTEARTALRFGEQTWGLDKIYHYDNFGVVAPLFSGANKDNIHFSKDIIRKIAKHEGLLETLTTYLDSDLSLTKTSKKLKIHRNTLVYRLNRIDELTSLDPKSFNDAFQLKVALVLDKYHDYK